MWPVYKISQNVAKQRVSKHCQFVANLFLYTLIICNKFDTLYKVLIVIGMLFIDTRLISSSTGHLTNL
jgi:hypothetical protein